MNVVRGSGVVISDGDAKGGRMFPIDRWTTSLPSYPRRKGQDTCDVANSHLPPLAAEQDERGPEPITPGMDRVGCCGRFVGLLAGAQACGVQTQSCEAVLGSTLKALQGPPEVPDGVPDER